MDAQVARTLVHTIQLQVEVGETVDVAGAHVAAAASTLDDIPAMYTSAVGIYAGEEPGLCPILCAVYLWTPNNKFNSYLPA